MDGVFLGFCGGVNGAGTFGSRREADRAWRDAEARVREDRYVDVRNGRQHFQRFVLATWLPNHVMEATTREGYRAGRCYRHGTLTGYSMGRCRCACCRAAYARYRAVRRRAGLDRPPVGRPVATDGHLPRAWFRDRIWNPVLAAAGIGRLMRFHGLRHTLASWLLAGGADLHTVPTSRDVGLDALARIRSQAGCGTAAAHHAVGA